MGKGDRKRKAKRRVQAANVQRVRGQAKPSGDMGLPDNAARPNEHRMARGKWAMPSGAAKSTMPAVDLAPDMVGQLYAARSITISQEQAARAFQEARDAYIREHGLRAFKSCIAGGVPHYDDGPGNASVIARYRSIEAKLTLRQRSEVLRVCVDDQRPASLDILRAALDRLAS